MGTDALLTYKLRKKTKCIHFCEAQVRVRYQTSLSGMKYQISLTIFTSLALLHLSWKQSYLSLHFLSVIR